jgi:hypothetical protein
MQQQRESAQQTAACQEANVTELAMAVHLVECLARGGTGLLVSARARALVTCSPQKDKAFQAPFHL